MPALRGCESGSRQRDAFIDRRVEFHSKVEEALRSHPDQELAIKATNSIRAGRSQLDQIKAALCQKFVELWQSDLGEWRRHLTELPHASSITAAFNTLGLEYSYFVPNTRYFRP